jgi:multicomponent Na+:H+ antiporter subunit D
MTIQNNETYLLLCLLIPLVGVLCSAIIRHGIVRDIINVAISIALFANMLKLFDIFKAQGVLAYKMFDILPSLALAFSIENLGMLFAMLVAFLWVISTIYSIGYMRGNNEAHQCRFYSFFALSIFATIGAAFAANLLTLFIFYELLTICTYPLVTHAGSSEAKKAGRVYLGILLATSIIFFLPAIMLTYNIAGTLDFTTGGIFAGRLGFGAASLILFLYVFGIGKTAIMPIHKWLPEAMVAPTPVSALLHAVAVVKVGVFTLLKVFIYIFGMEFLNSFMHQNWWNGDWILYLSGFTIIAASFIALKQDSLKKMLAYSTISQLSYIIMAISILTPKATIAAIFHIIAHALAKITLFFAAGAIYTSANKTKISQLSGVGKHMPWTMTAFAIAAISMIGVPPGAGFITKWNIAVGAFSVEMYWIVSVLVLSTLLNAAYLLPIIYKAFFGKEEFTTGITIAKAYGEAPVLMVAAMMVTAIATLVLFFFPAVILSMAEVLG